jgi:endonuclease YncB( thermonuclease family)
MGCQTSLPLVVQVLSVDTIVLQNGRKVRLAGVEGTKEGTAHFEFCRQANAYLVENKSVKFIEEKELSQRDMMVAYLYTPVIVSGKEQKYLFVNAELVRFGFAKAKPISEKCRYRDLWKNLLDLQEQEAKPLYRGIWSKGVMHEEKTPFSREKR